jgi:hypothetical protein
MTVTNSQGRTFEPATATAAKKNLIGTHAYMYKDAANTQKDPYRFWAVEIPDQEGTLEAFEIIMVIPLGGAYSGLYRYPRIGEEVLVGLQETGGSVVRYLMGYIPTSSNPFNTSRAGAKETDERIENNEQVLERQGELLRYASWADAWGGPYSELGFYQEPKAQWPLTAGGDDFPSIDVLTLNSTGNIREIAQYHHLQKAARIEILANTPEVIDRKTNAIDDHGTLPVGDLPGDDSSLHRGDIHIRAQKRVIIKADEEIRLQVGRSVLRIDDQGINLITKNIAGNYINSYDTTLDMNPRNGINMTGKNIALNAAYRFNAGDGLGGTVATTMGNLNLGGREVGIESYNNAEYWSNILYQALEYLVNTSSGAMALSKADIEIANYQKFTTDTLKSLGKILTKIHGLWAKRKEIRKERQEWEKAERLRKEQEEEERRQRWEQEAEEQRKRKEQEEDEQHPGQAERRKRRREAEALALEFVQLTKEGDGVIALLDGDLEEKEKQARAIDREISAASRDASSAEDNARRLDAEAGDLEAAAAAGGEDAENKRAQAQGKRDEANAAREEAARLRDYIKTKDDEYDAVTATMPAARNKMMDYLDWANRKNTLSVNLMREDCPDEVIAFNRATLKMSEANLDIVYGDPGGKAAALAALNAAWEEMQSIFAGSGHLKSDSGQRGSDYGVMKENIDYAERVYRFRNGLPPPDQQPIFYDEDESSV